MTNNNMKTIIIAGLLVVSSVAALAAPAKTSKPVALTDNQMQAVKGQGVMTVYAWNGSSYYVVFHADVGNTTWSTHTVYSGGPQNGVYYTY